MEGIFIMSFSNILKHLRRQNDMTQDDLAEALGLTPQAISRWENGAVYPDSIIIRKLAYMFNVTTDYLLEVDPVRMENKVDEILASVERMKPEEAVQVLREALVSYPRNLRLMSALSFCLYYRIYHCHPEDKKSKKVLDEAIELEEYLHEHPAHDGTIYGSAYSLLGMYRDAGLLEKGKALLNTLGDYSQVKQEMAIQLATGEERIRLMQENAHILLSKLSWQVYLLSLEDKFNCEQKIKMLTQMYETSRTLMPDDNPYFYNDQPTHIPWQLAKHYSEAGMVDKAIHWLEVMRDTAMMADSFEGEKKFKLKSPAFEQYELRKASGTWGSDWILDVMGDSYFDNIRDDERFRQIADSLKK